MTPRTILAVGAHIGDMDLAAGPILAQNVLDGGRSVLLALTPGERGHPRLGVEEYKAQKIQETQDLASGIGAEAIVFDDQSDGFLENNDALADRVAMISRDIEADLMLAHWGQSLHRDHENASLIAERARFLSGLPGHRENDHPRRGIAGFYFTENWEDEPGFEADTFVEISQQAHDLWLQAISGQAFARGETYGFRYIDYYDAQMTMRGALAGVRYAVGLSAPTFPSMRELP